MSKKKMFITFEFSVLSLIYTRLWMVFDCVFIFRLNFILLLKVVASERSSNTRKKNEEISKIYVIFAHSLRKNVFCFEILFWLLGPNKTITEHKHLLIFACVSAATAMVAFVFLHPDSFSVEFVKYCGYN